MSKNPIAHSIAVSLADNLVPSEYLRCHGEQPNPALDSCINEYIKGFLMCLPQARKTALESEARESDCGDSYALIRSELHIVARGRNLTAASKL